MFHKLVHTTQTRGANGSGPTDRAYAAWEARACGPVGPTRCGSTSGMRSASTLPRSSSRRRSPGPSPFRPTPSATREPAHAAPPAHPCCPPCARALATRVPCLTRCPTLRLARCRGTANEPLLSHHVSSPGTLVQQYPAVAGPFSGEHAFAEELRPRPARRRKPGPKKPIISKKMWKCLNTPAVRAGEEFARTVVERNVDAEKTAANEKMARQMYMRSSARFSVSERAFSREFLETRAGQKRFGTSLSEGGLTGAHTTSQDSLGQSLPKSSHTAGSHSSRAEVLPGDLLASLERYSRNPGSLMHEKKSILQNGFLSRDGHREKVQPRFQIDDKQRTTRRVITGGTVDRLHYSDGSLAVLLPPKVVSADPSLASKPLILRDGTASTIRARTLPRPYPPREVSTAGELVMEVPSLSSVTLPTSITQMLMNLQRVDHHSQPFEDHLLEEKPSTWCSLLALLDLRMPPWLLSHMGQSSMAGAYCPHAILRADAGRRHRGRGRRLPPKELCFTLVHAVGWKYLAEPGLIRIFPCFGLLSSLPASLFCSLVYVCANPREVGPRESEGQSGMQTGTSEKAWRHADVKIHIHTHTMYCSCLLRKIQKSLLPRCPREAGRS